MKGFNEITIQPELLTEYAHATKNEILLHLAIKSIATDGKARRNINHISVSLGVCPKRLRECEYRLKRRGVLRIHVVSGKRFWYVYDQPISATAPIEEPIIATPTTSIEESPKPRSIWHKIRHVIGWTHERKKP